MKSIEGQRVEVSPNTSRGSSDGDQLKGFSKKKNQGQPKKKEGKISIKAAYKLSTSAKRIHKELAVITLDLLSNCCTGPKEDIVNESTTIILKAKE
uniref:Uncharacterized protein n=1 Tax=Vombatus ursinus TaxID=29139 RepID=A0A4X2L0N8_VOMUR